MGLGNSSVACLLLACTILAATGLQSVLERSIGIRFLVTVNDTWDPNGCIATVATPMLMSGKKYNESGQIQVGSCDHGPLDFTVQEGSDDGYSKMSILQLSLGHPSESCKIDRGGEDERELQDRSGRWDEDEFFYAQQVNVTFHSSVIEDAMPPTCLIPWNGSYLNPTSSTTSQSPLPACFVVDSREGWFETHYWFRILEWRFF